MSSASQILPGSFSGDVRDAPRGDARVRDRRTGDRARTNDETPFVRAMDDTLDSQNARASSLP